MKKEEKGFTATQEQIDAWKAKHGEDNIFGLEVEDAKDECTRRAYVRVPNRKDLSYAMTVGKDPIKFNEAILNRCWLDGDEKIKTDDALFMGVSGQLDQLVPAAEATIKKL